jgi:hypothetical protein
VFTVEGAAPHYASPELRKGTGTRGRGHSGTNGACPCGARRGRTVDRDQARTATVAPSSVHRSRPVLPARTRGS